MICIFVCRILLIVSELLLEKMFLFLVRGCRPGKSVQMTEAEVRGLCLKSREIFLQQPILLELEAPLKICGKFLSVVCYFKSLSLRIIQTFGGIFRVFIIIIDIKI